MSSSSWTNEVIFDGDLLYPGDPEYDDARRVFNTMFDRRPAAIARCASERDVVAALAYAAGRGVPVSVRAGGHHAAGFSVIDNGVVIDVRGLKGVAVDPQTRTARVGAGLTWAELDAATQQYGLAVTGGRMSSTGVGGLTIGSGSGWLERAIGLTPDNVLGLRVVTADGRVVVANADENPDLFWALRGGGGNFGVVTEFTFQLMELGPIVRGGLRLYPLAQAAEVARVYTKVMAQAPDQLCGGLAFISAPPAPFVPPEYVGKPAVAVVVLWAGPTEEADAGLAPLAALGEPIVDLVTDLPYVEVQQLLDAAYPYGQLREYMASGFLEELDDFAIETLIDAAAGFRSPVSAIVVQPMGGGYGRVANDATPLAHRDAGWAYQLLAVWADSSEDDEHRAWTRLVDARLQQQGEPASFPNFVADLEPGVMRRAYPAATLERLQAAKRAWDPTNVFSSNHSLL
jgi:FAD/FMN-containing dehydrogenase